MSNLGKNYKRAAEKVEQRPYPLVDAIRLVEETAFAKFDETVEIALRLGVDPKHADQMVRGTVVLPHGTGKAMRVLVFASGEMIREAEEAGAEYVGGEELAKKIEGGWLDFEAVVAAPDMMRVVGRLGKILGPRGLMPNPKTGTVTPEVARAVQEIKAGKVEFRVDKAQALISAVIRSRPPAAKGKYIRSVSISSTMGPGVKVDETALVAAEA